MTIVKIGVKCNPNDMTTLYGSDKLLFVPSLVKFIIFMLNIGNCLIPDLILQSIHVAHIRQDFVLILGLSMY